MKYDVSYISQRIEFTGKAKQWQINSAKIFYFGSLLDNLEFNSNNEFITNSREEADRKYLKEIRESLCGNG